MEIEALPLEELPDGSMRLVPGNGATIGLYRCAGALYAIEDRCSHDDGPLCEGVWDADTCEVECPRHGSRFDLRTGKPSGPPATEPVPTYPVRVEGDDVLVDVATPRPTDLD